MAWIAENTFCTGRKVKEGISDYPFPGEIKLKISSLFFSSPYLSFPTQKCKLLGIALSDYSKSINQENLPVC